MKRPDLALKNDVDEYMRGLGFYFVRSQEIYIRPFDGGFHQFSWSMYATSRDSFEGHYGIGVRHDSIEELLVTARNIHGPENRRYAETVYRDVGGFFPFDSKRDRLLRVRIQALKSDVSDAVGRIEQMLAEDGAHWYALYSSTLEVSRKVNDPVDTSAAHELVNNPQLRPIVGVAAACIAEPSRVEELVEAYLATLRRDDARLAHLRQPLAPTMAAKFDSIISAAGRR